MPTPLPPSDHRVSLDDALAMRKRHAAARTSALRAQPSGAQPSGPNAFAFHREAYDRILAQPGCVGVRTYPVTHENGAQSYVLVGVDEKGNDMLGELANDGIECPPWCDENSPLADAR